MGASNGKKQSNKSSKTNTKFDFDSSDPLPNDNYEENKAQFLSDFQTLISLSSQNDQTPISKSKSDIPKDLESQIKSINSSSLELIDNLKREFISHITSQKNILFQTTKSAQEKLASINQKFLTKKEKSLSDEQLNKIYNDFLNEIKSIISSKETENQKIIKKNPKQGKIYKNKIVKLLNEINKDNSNLTKKNSKFYSDIEKNYEKHYYLFSNDIYYCDKKKKENCPFNYLITVSLTKLEEVFSTKIEKLKKEFNTKNIKLEQKIKGEVNEVLEVYLKKTKEEKNELITKLKNILSESENDLNSKKNTYNDKISNKLEEIEKAYLNYENEMEQNMNDLIIKENNDKRKKEYEKKYIEFEKELTEANKVRVEKIKEEVTKEILEIREKNKGREIDKKNDKLKNIGYGEVKKVDKDLLKELNEGCEICPIDNEAYELDQFIIICPCGHKYHFACIEEWTKEHETCPICRKKLK